MNCYTCCRTGRSTWSALMIRLKPGTRQWCFYKSPSCKKTIGTHFHHEHTAYAATEKWAGKVHRRFWLCIQRAVVRFSHTDQLEGASFPRRPRHCAWHFSAYHVGRICPHLPGNRGGDGRGDV